MIYVHVSRRDPTPRHPTLLRTSTPLPGVMDRRILADRTPHPPLHVSSQLSREEPLPRLTTTSPTFTYHLPLVPHPRNPLRSGGSVLLPEVSPRNLGTLAQVPVLPSSSRTEVVKGKDGSRSSSQSSSFHIRGHLEDNVIF
ncbi:Hypothetical predicted protein [Marmota monax]|uniref:Uncharacterized protein n=1 Tax=Marmota monax TaxID=9995 RepID=A0A5E4BT79_MARMO|nr:Hypothetical predicted protein [Marmota monax]